ncbi:MAG: lasso peptide biosynthesis B2 protein [Lysobacterales bacterium]|nr:MAG: lasso peptide biosynthesis B2 protein [Xanthomonadales bacterium]
MTQAIRKFLALPRNERWLLVQALTTLPLVTLSLRAIGLRRCCLALERLLQTPGESMFTETSARYLGTRMGWLVRVASTHGLFRANCLAQSLTIWCLLRRQGIPVSLRIGVRKQQGRLEAHAWTEHQTRVLNDDANIASRYSPFGNVHEVFEIRGADTP